MKQKIMEALLDSNHNLTKEEIMWAASHLPNNTEPGEHKKTTSVYVYDHEKEDLFDAIGCDRADAELAADIMTDVTKKIAMKENYKISNGIEEIMTRAEGINGFFPLILSKVLRETLERIEERELPKELLKFLKYVRKKSKEDDDE